jgi:precorrin-2 methylase
LQRRLSRRFMASGTVPGVIAFVAFLATFRLTVTKTP